MKVLMDKYFALIKLYVKDYLKYPARVFIKLIYLPVQMLIYIFLWSKLNIRNNITDIHYMISYYLITTLLINAYPFRHIALQIEEDVINGTIANYLIRPCDYSVYMFSKYLAWNLIYLIIFIPALIFVYFYNRIAMVNIIYFVFAVLLTKFIEFMTWYNIGLISLFIEKIKGIIITISAFMLFLSGNLIPLIFFPKWLENITLFFPFRIYIYFPASILLNKYDADYFLYNILQSLLWGFCFIVLSKLLWNSGMKKLETNIS